MAESAAIVTGYLTENRLASWCKVFLSIERPQKHDFVIIYEITISIMFI